MAGPFYLRRIIEQWDSRTCRALFFFFIIKIIAQEATYDGPNDKAFMANRSDFEEESKHKRFALHCSLSQFQPVAIVISVTSIFMEESMVVRENENLADVGAFDKGLTGLEKSAMQEFSGISGSCCKVKNFLNSAMEIKHLVQVQRTSLLCHHSSYIKYELKQKPHGWNHKERLATALDCTVHILHSMLARKTLKKPFCNLRDAKSPQNEKTLDPRHHQTQPRNGPGQKVFEHYVTTDKVAEEPNIHKGDSDTFTPCSAQKKFLEENYSECCSENNNDPAYPEDQYLTSCTNLYGKCYDGNEGEQKKQSNANSQQPHVTSSTCSGAGRPQGFGQATSSSTQQGSGGDGEDPPRPTDEKKIGGCSNSGRKRKSGRQSESDEEPSEAKKNRHGIETHQPGSSTSNPPSNPATQMPRQLSPNSSFFNLVRNNLDSTTESLLDQDEMTDIGYSGDDTETLLQEDQLQDLLVNPTDPTDLFRTSKEFLNSHINAGDAHSSPTANSGERDLHLDHEQHRIFRPQNEMMENCPSVPGSGEEDSRQIPPPVGDSTSPFQVCSDSGPITNNHCHSPSREGIGGRNQFEAATGQETQNGPVYDRRYNAGCYSGQEIDLQRGHCARGEMNVEAGLETQPSFAHPRQNRTFDNPRGCYGRRSWCCQSCGLLHLIDGPPEHICDNCGRFYCLDHWERHNCERWFVDHGVDEFLDAERFDDNRGDGNLDDIGSNAGEQREVQILNEADVVPAPVNLPNEEHGNEGGDQIEAQHPVQESMQNDIQELEDSDLDDGGQDEDREDRSSENDSEICDCRAGGRRNSSSK